MENPLIIRSFSHNSFYSDYFAKREDKGSDAKKSELNSWLDNKKSEDSSLDHRKCKHVEEQVFFELFECEGPDTTLWKRKSVRVDLTPYMKAKWIFSRIRMSAEQRLSSKSRQGLWYASRQILQAYENGDEDARVFLRKIVNITKKDFSYEIRNKKGEYFPIHPCDLFIYKMIDRQTNVLIKKGEIVKALEFNNDIFKDPFDGVEDLLKAYFRNQLKKTKVTDDVILWIRNYGNKLKNPKGINNHLLDGAIRVLETIPDNTDAKDCISRLHGKRRKIEININELKARLLAIDQFVRGNHYVSNKNEDAIEDVGRALEALCAEDKKEAVGFIKQICYNCYNSLLFSQSRIELLPEIANRVCYAFMKALIERELNEDDLSQHSYFRGMQCLLKVLESNSEKQVLEVIVVTCYHFMSIYVRDFNELNKGQKLVNVLKDKVFHENMCDEMSLKESFRELFLSIFTQEILSSHNCTTKSPHREALRTVFNVINNRLEKSSNDSERSALSKIKSCFCDKFLEKIDNHPIVTMEKITWFLRHSIPILCEQTCIREKYHLELFLLKEKGFIDDLMYVYCDVLFDNNAYFDLKEASHEFWPFDEGYYVRRKTSEMVTKRSFESLFKLSLAMYGNPLGNRYFNGYTLLKNTEGFAFAHSLKEYGLKNVVAEVISMLMHAKNNVAAQCNVGILVALNRCGIDDPLRMREIRKEQFYRICFYEKYCSNECEEAGWSLGELGHLKKLLATGNSEHYSSLIAEYKIRENDAKESFIDRHRPDQFEDECLEEIKNSLRDIFQSPMPDEFNVLLKLDDLYDLDDVVLWLGQAVFLEERGEQEDASMLKYLAAILLAECLKKDEFRALPLLKKLAIRLDTTQMLQRYYFDKEQFLKIFQINEELWNDPYLGVYDQMKSILRSNIRQDALTSTALIPQATTPVIIEQNACNSVSQIEALVTAIMRYVFAMNADDYRQKTTRSITLALLLGVPDSACKRYALGQLALTYRAFARKGELMDPSGQNIWEEDYAIDPAEAYNWMKELANKGYEDAPKIIEWHGHRNEGRMNEAALYPWDAYYLG